MIIDSHTHFYDPGRKEGVPWPKDDSVLYRTVLPENFKTVANPSGVTGTVVVEASPWLEDNQWILDLAEHEPAIVGFIGNLDLRDDAFQENLNRFTGYTKFRGVRARGFSIESLLEEPEFSGLQYLESLGLTVDLMVKPETLTSACEFAQKLPKLSIVVDHLAHVTIDGNTPDPQWADGMAALAKYANVCCKFSRITESATPWPASTDLDFYRPTFDMLWKTFGPERLPWGSNWPVTELASDYATTVDLVRSYLSDKTAEDREQVFWKASQKAYGWQK